MRQQAKLFLTRSHNSLTLAIEHFNRPFDLGRSEAVLMFLDHAIEMFLKAALFHRGGTIYDHHEKQTIGFDKCVHKALTDGKCRFLTPEQARLLQVINGLRDAAQHDTIILSEQLLYLHAQAGISLYGDLLRDVFQIDLATRLPPRVLPLSTHLPMDLLALFERDMEEIRRLLRPGKRQRVEAMNRLRGLAIVEHAIRGGVGLPSEEELFRTAVGIRAGEAWEVIFPTVASVNLTALGYGPSIDLRITTKGKSAAFPVHLVPEGTPGAPTVAIKRVDELGFYNLGRDDLARRAGLSGPKTTAMIRYLGLQSDPDCFKEFTIGKLKVQRYSQKAIAKIKEALPQCSIDEVWKRYGTQPKQSA